MHPDKSRLESRVHRPISDTLYDAFIALDDACRNDALDRMDDQLKMLFHLLEHMTAYRYTVRCKHPGLIDFESDEGRLQIIFTPNTLECDIYFPGLREAFDCDANNYGTLQLKQWLETLFPLNEVLL